MGWLPWPALQPYTAGLLLLLLPLMMLLLLLLLSYLGNCAAATVHTHALPLSAYNSLSCTRTLKPYKQL